METVRAARGMVVAPHFLAARAGREVLRAGGTAVEAVVCAAAVLSVVYPHMCGLGGDGFWLIHEPGRDPIGLDASGRSGRGVTPESLRAAGFDAVPPRGPWAALTVAGAVSGWAAALELARDRGRPLPLQDLLAPAVTLARQGFAVSRSQHRLTTAGLSGLAAQPGFAGIFLQDGRSPAVGAAMKLPVLAGTLEHLADAGLDDFYRGDLARSLAKDLEQAGSPLRLEDLAAQRAARVRPLRLDLSGDRVFNLPPPSQGLASLVVLGLFERLGVQKAEGFAHVHGLVEATKAAFRLRDRVVGDPDHLPADPASFLQPDRLEVMARDIDLRRAAPWPAGPGAGDTVWIGAVDAQGWAVSCLQSIFFDFGSGVVLPESGLLWHNRACSFRVRGEGPNILGPGRKPFHTLNPALARLRDGRVMPYGAMGGEGQPQTQSAVFTRFVRFGQDLQAAISAPRWLLGRAWGAESVSLKLEERFDPELVARLRAAGHAVELVEGYSSFMGHAGAIVRHPDGSLEGASDPRCDGEAAGW